jgi:O-6-methylguanine DNA methyltransferase
MNSHRVPIATADGTFTARFSATGLAGLEFPSVAPVARRAPQPPQLEASPNPHAAPLPAPLARWRAVTARALAEALAGKAPQELPPLDLSVGTAFQRRVWAALAGIPCSQTRTYAQIAAAIGRPRAARAVGQACGANPIPVLIPCHRVLGAGGALGGFSAGLEWKRRLLAREKQPAAAAKSQTPRRQDAALRRRTPDQKMATGCVRAKRLGLRQSAAAFAVGPQARAPGDWRTPRRFAPATARSIFIACGAAD